MANGKRKGPRTCDDCGQPILRDTYTGERVCGCGDEDNLMGQQHDQFSQYCNYRELDFDDEM